jgi:cyclopropane fatty-acyl-phospholipid synthase-like methyltransferase
MSDWFEQQYSDPQSDYSRCYRYGVPRGAIEENQFCTDFTIAILGLHPVNDTVLELGAGMGYVIDSWERRGFRCLGVEISHTAAELSERRNIMVDDALSALRGMPDNAFTVGYSSQFLEHIPREQLPELFVEMKRVAPLWAHYIAHEVGDDPSHVTIMEPKEWIDCINSWIDTTALAVPNPLYHHFPLFVHSSIGLPSRVRRALWVRKSLENRNVGEAERGTESAQG